MEDTRSDRPTDEWRLWLKILHHEAAHAAVSLHEIGESAKIVVRCPIGGDGARHPAGTFTKGVKLVVGRPQSILSLVKIIAAGGQAELEWFGEKSEGSVNDEAQIRRLLSGRRDPEALEEQKNEYAGTRRLVRQLTDQIEMIVQSGTKSFEAKELLGKVFDDTELLSAVEVRRLFDGNEGAKTGFPGQDAKDQTELSASELLARYLATDEDLDSDLNRRVVETMTNDIDFARLRQIRKLVQREGQHFAPEPYRGQYEPENRGGFYKTAMECAIEKGLIYVEGFILLKGAMIAYHYAWCIDRSGQVYDFANPGKPIAYCGVCFNTEYVRERLSYFNNNVVEGMTGSLLDDATNDWAIVEGRFSAWKYR